MRYEFNVLKLESNGHHLLAYVQSKKNDPLAIRLIDEEVTFLFILGRIFLQVTKDMVLTKHQEIQPCPDKPVYILPLGMTGAKLKRIKKHDPMNEVFPQIK